MADTRRTGAGPADFSTRSVAGVELRCASVPIEGVVATTYCLTELGVFGLVESTAVRYELVSFEPGDSGEDVAPPYPFAKDDSFLSDR
jgi:hypothetical protein